MVDFQSSRPSRHSCLIAAAMDELRAAPGTRVVGAGLPSKTLLWWEELAPGVRVGMLRRSAGLHTVDELCAAAGSGEGGFRFHSDSVISALKKAYAGGGPVAVTWIGEEEKRRLIVQPDVGEPDEAPLRQKTLALAEPSTDLRLKDGCWEKATRGWVYSFVEGLGGLALKQRSSFEPGAASERLCFDVPRNGPARVVIWDERANWLGVATVQ